MHLPCGSTHHAISPQYMEFTLILYHIMDITALSLLSTGPEFCAHLSRVAWSYPDGISELMLAGTRIRYIATTSWGTKRYLNMALLMDGQLDNVADANKTYAGPHPQMCEKSLTLPESQH